MKPNAATLFALLALSACSGPLRLGFVFEDDLPSDQSYAVEQAAKTWNDLIGEPVFVPGGENHVTVGVLHDCGDRAGVAYIDSYRIELCSEPPFTYSYQWMEWVAAHELGHIMGLDHVDDVANVMYPVAPGFHTTDPWVPSDEQLGYLREIAKE